MFARWSLESGIVPGFMHARRLWLDGLLCRAAESISLSGKGVYVIEGWFLILNCSIHQKNVVNSTEVDQLDAC